jgi:hypothetical protein
MAFMLNEQPPDTEEEWADHQETVGLGVGCILTLALIGAIYWHLIR